MGLKLAFCLDYQLIFTFLELNYLAKKARYGTRRVSLL